jgi:hypothetical protein
VAGLLADRADRLVHAADFLRAAGQVRVRPEPARGRAVAAGGDDGARRDEHPRPRDQSVVDRLLHRHVVVAGALGAEVAERGEAGHQRVARVVRRFDRAVGRRFLEHLVVPRGLVVRMQEHVRVQVDEARQQGGAGQFDALRVGRRADRGGRADGRDLAVAHQHRPTGIRGVAVGGPHAVGEQQPGAAGRSGGRRREGGEGEQQGEQRPGHADLLGAAKPTMGRPYRSSR